MKRLQARIDDLTFQLYHRDVAGKLEAFSWFLKASRAPMVVPTEVEQMAGSARHAITQFNAFGDSLSGRLMSRRVDRVLTHRYYRHQSKVDSDAQFLSVAADRLRNPESRLGFWGRLLVGSGPGYRKQRAY